MTLTSAPTLFSIDERPFGSSYADWTVRWWKWWCGSKTVPMHGEYDNVAFLTTKSMQRNDKELLKVDNTISQDKAILFPVDKWLSVGFPFTTDNELKDVAKERIDVLVKVSIGFDGYQLTPSRIQSDVFQLDLKRDIFNPEVPESVKKIVKGKYKAVGEGYWIFLKPNILDKGEHKIHSFATCASEVLSLYVDHNISIV